ncbi:methyl-accepting chemotaxis protein [Paenibacillus taihuensis]|uniref:Methyl-accepting chemotaxis protein n=1 Tax=Paenibacillus taihuensis TaxID=1156355 RepID=A0A3D9S8F6_9BACL|nr:methyl-accepting chemotaxis protein [Paenibacillus taihuensis]REE85115.1 methyl-accepting chemotaxis protein [Paenibacillus taihuensis]
MLKEKNRVMLFIAAGILLLSLLAHVLQSFGLTMAQAHHEHMMSLSSGLKALNTVILVLPIVCLLAAIASMGLNRESASIPHFLTLSLTFSSMSIIAGGQGMVEYHFSIFMVLAIILYYEMISLLLISTVLFALQHVLGFLFFPVLVYGTNDYAFSMVLIHIIFVLLFISAATYQIVARRALIRGIEEKQSERLKETVTQIVDSITETSDKVLRNSRELSGNATTLNQLAEGVMQTMQQVDQTAYMQEHGAFTSRKVIEEMLRDICTIAETSATVSDFSTAVAKEADNGNEAIQKAVMQMRAMNAAVENSSAKVRLLGERSQEIDDITRLITDIASQTNLLALNAAIEAARAGEHGRGFTVVSNEVRKLSEQTSESAQRIADLVQDIQENNRISIEAMDQVIAEAHFGNQAVADAGTAFERILQSVRIVADQIHHISGASQQMSASTQQFSVSMDDISRLSTELSSSVKAVTGSSSEQNELISRSSELACMLEKLSDKLDQIIVSTKQNFQIG